MKKQSQEILTKNAFVYTFAIICCLLWGSAFPSIKIGYSLLNIKSGNYASQILFAGTRFTFTGIFTILIFSLFTKRFMVPKKSSWLSIGKLGLMQTVAQYLFFYIGLSNTTSSKASIINGSSPFFAIIFACFVFGKEKFTKSKLIGSLLGFAGIILVNLDFNGFGGGMSFKGEGFMLISSIACALSSSMIKIYAEKENPVVLTGYQFIFGGIIMIAAGLIMGGSLRFNSPESVLILFYLTMLSVAAYSIWSILLKYNDVSKVVIFSFTITVFGVFLSALLLGETKQAFNPQSLLSLLFVCLGIIAINNSKPKVNSR